MPATTLKLPAALKQRIAISDRLATRSFRMRVNDGM